MYWIFPILDQNRGKPVNKIAKYCVSPDFFLINERMHVEIFAYQFYVVQSADKGHFLHSN